MAEKETDRLISVMQRLMRIESKNTKTPNTAEKGKKAKEAFEKFLQTQRGINRIESEKKSAQTWIEKAFSQEKNERILAQEEAKKTGKKDYEGIDRKTITEIQNTLDVSLAFAQEESVDVQWVKDSVKDIKNTPLALEFASRLAVLPKELQEDPAVLYRETMKAYHALDWTSVSDEQVKEMRGVLNGALAKAQDLWEAMPQRATEGPRDAVVFKQYLDERFDLYRTERIDIRSKTEIENLGKYLSVAQVKYDASDFQSVNTKTDELKFLRDTRDALSSGNATLYEDSARKPGLLEKKTLPLDKDEAKKYIAKINTRINQLDNDKAPFGNNPRYGQGDAENAAFLQKIHDLKGGIDDVEKNNFLEKLNSPQLKKIANETFSSGLTDEQRQKKLQEIEKLLMVGGLESSVREQLKLSGEADPYSDIAKSKIAFEVENAKKLTQYLRQGALRDPTNGHWGDKTNAPDLNTMRMLTITNFDILDPTNQNIDEVRNVDRIFLKILAVVDYKPQDSFRESFNLTNENDLQFFFRMLENRLEESGATRTQTLQALERYTRIRNLKEAYHNFNYLALTSDFEQLAKYASSFQSGDADFMFANLRFVQAAKRAQEAVLFRMVADRGGFFPVELFAKNSSSSAEWENQSLALLQNIVFAGDEFKNATPEQKAALEWELRVAASFAKGFSIIELRLPEMVGMSKSAPEYASLFQNKMSRAMDPFTHLVENFGIGKPGLLGIYTKKVRNLLQTSTRWGGDSNWAARRVFEEMPREIYEKRGVGIRLSDNKSRMESLVKDKHKAIIDRLYPNSKNKERDTRNYYKKHYHEIEHEIEQAVEHEAINIISEAVQQLPLVIARHWMNEDEKAVYVNTDGQSGGRAVKKEGFWHQRRFDILQSILEADSLSVGSRTLSPTLTALGKEITSYWDLSRIAPGSVFEKQADRRLSKLGENEFDKVSTAWADVQKKIAKLENAVETVQQRALQTGKPLQDCFDVISDEGLRNLAKEYVRQIIAAGEGKYTPGGSDSYIEKLGKGYASGEERRILTTIDIPYEYMNMARAGEDILLRRINDVNNLNKSAFGIGDYLKLLEAHVDQQKLAAAFLEKVFATAEMVDTAIAQKLGYYIAGRTTLNFYAESGWASYTGFFGDIFPGLLGQGKQASLAKRLYGRGADAWGPDKRYEWIHILEGKRIVNASGGIDGGIYDYGASEHKFSGHALMSETGSGVANIALEVGMYIFMTGALLTLITALREGSSEVDDGTGKKKSGH